MCMCHAYCLNTDANRRLRQHCQYGGQHVVRTDKSFGPQVQCGREQNMNFICGPFRTIVIVTIGARALVRRSLISDHTNAGGSGGVCVFHKIARVVHMSHTLMCYSWRHTHTRPQRMSQRRSTFICAPASGPNHHPYNHRIQYNRFVVAGQWVLSCYIIKTHTWHSARWSRTCAHLEHIGAFD